MSVEHPKSGEGVPEGVDWSKPIEAVHTDGRVRAVKIGQLNAGANTGNDHWLWTADSRRLDSTPGALGSFWVSKDGAVPSYSGWRIRNAASPHPNTAGEGAYSAEDEALYTRWLAGDETLPALEREQHLRFQTRSDCETRERAKTAAELARIQLLADVELHLQSCRIFLTSREKMHPCGVEIHDEIHARVTAAINDGGARV